GISRPLAYAFDTRQIAHAGGGSELPLRPLRKGRRHLAVERDRRLDFDAARQAADLNRVVDAARTTLVDRPEIAVFHAEPLELAAAVGFVGRHDAGLVERRDRRRIGERRIGRNEPLEAGAGNPRRRDVEVGRRTQEIVDGAGGDQTGYEQGKPDLDAPAKNSAAVETRYNQPERPVTNQRGPDNFRLIGTIGPKGKRKLSACVHHYGKR